METDLGTFQRLIVGADLHVNETRFNNKNLYSFPGQNRTFFINAFQVFLPIKKQDLFPQYCSKKQKLW